MAQGLNKIVIGIAGGTGSGKTTLIERIQTEFKEGIVVLAHDYYYKDRSELELKERERLNYDHPDSFETDLLIYHINKLKNGESVFRPVYDFTIHNRTKEKVKVDTADVIIVEGILIFENRELRNLFDIKIFIDTDADVRIIRRILRDVKERERSLDSIVNQYMSTVKLMHEQFVEPSKKYADIIVPEGGFNTVALEMINERIHALLEKK